MSAESPEVLSDDKELENSNVEESAIAVLDEDDDDDALVESTEDESPVVVLDEDDEDEDEGSEDVPEDGGDSEDVPEPAVVLDEDDDDDLEDDSQDVPEDDTDSEDDGTDDSEVVSEPAAVLDEDDDDDLEDEESPESEDVDDEDDDYEESTESESEDIDDEDDDYEESTESSEEDAKGEDVDDYDEDEESTETTKSSEEDGEDFEEDFDEESTESSEEDDEDFDEDFYDDSPADLTEADAEGVFAEGSSSIGGAPREFQGVLNSYSWDLQKIVASAIQVNKNIFSFRSSTAKGLDESVREWRRVVSPIVVMKTPNYSSWCRTHDEETSNDVYRGTKYILLDGVRRLMGALQNEGHDKVMKVNAVVLDFQNPEEAARYVPLLYIYLSHERSHNIKEKWEMVKYLKRSVHLNPTLVDNLTSLPVGDSSKLETVMTSDQDELKQKLLDHEMPLEAVYKAVIKEEQSRSEEASLGDAVDGIVDPADREGKSFESVKDSLDIYEDGDDDDERIVSHNSVMMDEEDRPEENNELPLSDDQYGLLQEATQESLFTCTITGPGLPEEGIQINGTGGASDNGLLNVLQDMTGAFNSIGWELDINEVDRDALTEEELAVVYPEDVEEGSEDVEDDYEESTDSDEGEEVSDEDDYEESTEPDEDDYEESTEPDEDGYEESTESDEDVPEEGDSEGTDIEDEDVPEEDDSEGVFDEDDSEGTDIEDEDVPEEDGLEGVPDDEESEEVSEDVEDEDQDDTPVTIPGVDMSEFAY